MIRESYGIQQPMKQTPHNHSSRIHPPFPLSRPLLRLIGMLTFRAMYTLYILDSTRHVTDIPQAGVLGNMLGFQFGMYQPQSYTPLPSTLPPFPPPTPSPPAPGRVFPAFVCLSGSGLMVA